jgi:two-component system, cell cycle sensor histidine kinase and response regulator CckA
MDITMGRAHSPGPHEEHACCLYSSDGERRRQLTRFLLEGAQRGEQLICATSEAHMAAVLQDLQDGGVDPGPLVESGRLILTSTQDAYLGNGSFSPQRALARIESLVLQGSESGYPGVRITGDLQWLGEVPDALEAFFEYESEVNRILRSLGGAALCLYDRRQFSVGDLVRCLSLHPVALVGEDEVPNPYFVQPEELKGRDPISAELAWRRRALKDLREAETARRRLEESEARFQAMAESISDALLAIDAGSRVVYANPAAHRMTGVEDGGLVGGSLQDLIPEELRERHHAGMARYLESGERRLDWSGVEMRARRADGSRFDAEVSFGEYQVAGERFFTGVLRDVTERRRVQEDLRRSTQSLQAILDSAPMAILTVDPEGRVQDRNDGATRILGWEPGEAEGRPFLAVPAPGGAPDGEANGFPSLLRRVVREGPVSEVLELRRKGAEASFPAAVSAAPLHDEGGSASGVLLIVEDISRRRELEAQLRQAEKMEAVGRLAGGVAHDFNNLLTVVGGHARMALEAMDALGGAEAEEPGVDARGEVLAILDGVERASALTRQLLALGRAQVLEERVLDLADLVRQMKVMLRRLVPSGIELGLATAARGSLVRGDVNQFHRVVLNLVLNAADAVGDTGRIDIRVDTVEPRGASAPWVRLTVSDTGTGIHPAARDRIFDPFFTTKADKGTGLGLSTVLGIITQSGGRIEVDTEIGRGTAFHVLLPAVPEGEASGEPAGRTGPGEDDGGGVPVRGSEPSTPPPRRRGRPSVLLVEDDPALSSLVRRILQREGCRVLVAASGPEADAAARSVQGPLHLVVSDVVLPGTEGPALVDGIRRFHPGVPVIFMSGYAPDELPRGVMEKGTAFLSKPFSPRDLIRSVREILEEGAARPEG